MALLLLIEDEDILRENTQELLELHGFQCISARNGQEGIALAKEFIPDLVICDILLPITDGFSVKTQLNQFQPTDSVPFIFLTSKSERDDMRKAMNLGAMDYITKPFKIIEVVAAIDRILLQKIHLMESIDNHVIKAIIAYIKMARHECNTPLHAIITLTELLRDTNQSRDAIDEISRAINISGKRLSKTLNNLIELMRLKHFIPVDEAPKTITNVSELIVSTVTAHMKLSNRLRDLEINVDDVRSDEFSKEDLNILISELIDNALKFSKPFNRITVNFNEVINAQCYLLEVTSKLAIATTFTTADIHPFTQHDRSAHEQQGSGLGLYLALLVAAKYKGELKVVYQNGGEISIRVYLPMNIVGM